MAITIQSILILQKYLRGVMQRADHHANGVNEIALALIGGIIWRTTDEIEVKEYAGSPANILWMTVNENRYCFTYNHQKDCIEVKNRTQNGDVCFTFNNQTPIAEVKQFFAQL